MIDLRLALTIFVGTLPLLGAVLWNLMKIDRLEKRIDARLDAIATELIDIRKTLASLAERIATLEERDRWTHPVVHP